VRLLYRQRSCLYNGHTVQNLYSMDYKKFCAKNFWIEEADCSKVLYSAVRGEISLVEKLKIVYGKLQDITFHFG